MLFDLIFVRLKITKYCTYENIVFLHCDVSFDCCVTKWFRYAFNYHANHLPYSERSAAQQL